MNERIISGGPAASPTLSRVVQGGLCAGCGGCVVAAGPDKITMVQSPAGYARPRQMAALTEAEEDILSKACPGNRVEVSATEGTDHILWGPIIEARAGHATDPDVRFTASSGGALSALVLFLLESGAVDFVFQTAASDTAPLENKSVITTNRAGVLQAAGSRYAPSAPLADLPEALARPGRGAFVGKPCDVAAFRALAAKRSDIREKFPYAISFFCAGIPSLTGGREILAKLGTSSDQVTAFRYRGQGWPGQAAAELKDGSRAAMSYADSWGGILSRHVQFRCKICPDGTGAHADVVCADAWECDERGYPLFDEKDGTSLIVTRTQKGEALVQAAMAQKALQAEPCPVDGIAAMQPGQLGRRRLALSRLLALRVLLRPRPRFRGMHLFAAARKAGVRANLRSFLGTCRRIVLDART